MKFCCIWFMLGCLAVTPSPASAICPVSSYNVNSQEVPTPGPTGSGFHQEGGYYGFRTLQAAFNIPGATLSASASVGGDFGYWASATVVDDFDVVGPPPGTPVQMLATLRLDGAGSCGSNSAASVQGIIHDDFGHSVVASGCSVQTSLVLPVQIITGQPLRLTFFVYAFARHTGTGMSGTFSFSNVPAWASVISCNGYNSNPAVPTRPTSWGKLKTLYR